MNLKKHVLVLVHNLRRVVRSVTMAKENMILILEVYLSGKVVKMAKFANHSIIITKYIT